MGIDDYKINAIRKEISVEILNFVTDDNNKNRILLIRASQGLGKTITALLTLLSRGDILVVFVTYEHDQQENVVGNKILKDYNLFHLKSRSQKDDSGNLLCTNPLYPKLKEYTKNIKGLLCNSEKCEDYSTCGYIDQFRILLSNKQSWGGVHSHLNTIFLLDYLEEEIKEKDEEEDSEENNFDYRCLVIDENPVSSLISKTKITKKDLDDLIEIIKEIVDNYKNKRKSDYPEFSKHAWLVIHISNALKFLLEQTSKDGLGGLQFISVFEEGLRNNKISIDVLDKIQEEVKNCVKHRYSKVLLGKIENIIDKESEDKKRQFPKDVIDDVFQIAEKCIKYYKESSLEDINLPFFSEVVNTKKEGVPCEGKYIMSMKCNTELPEVPVIILDATGDKDFYEQIFNREVIEYNPSIKIPRNIYQIMKGMYYSKSLFTPKTRLRVFNEIYKLIKYHHRQNDGMVNIVTLKKYATIDDEKGKYLGMSIERYLKNKNVDMKKVRICHYGDVKGKNEMENDSVLILLGTPEPNIYTYPKEVGCWFEGEKKIDNSRIIESKNSPYYKHDYRYENPRYNAHVKHKRENEIEQAIERLRFALAKEEKVVYLFSMLPISFETKKTTINTLYYQILAKEEIGYFKVLDALETGRGKMSHKKLYNKTRRLVDVKKVGAPKIIQELLDRGIIIETGSRKKKVYQFAENGREYYISLKSSMKEFERG